MNMDNLVSWIVLTPLIGLVIVGFLRNIEAIRWATLGITLLTFGLAACLWAGFDYATSGMQFVDRVEWIPAFDIHYAVGVDGISLPLILLTTFLLPLCVLFSWRMTNIKAFMMFLLLAEVAVVGVFISLNAILFFVFWEITMIPLYFLIAVWGGPQRAGAAIKFVLFSLSGSLLLLVGFLALYQMGGDAFDILALAQVGYAPEVQFWIFLALFVGFAIKVPIIPFHSWLADAHSEAPTAGSVILSALLLKMGAYGFLRFCLPMLPEASAAFAPLIMWLSVLAILYGGAMAIAQHDFKRLIAYSSIAHMGFVTLGIFGFNNQSIQGAVLQMVNHGVATGALFLVAGMLYDRTKNRNIDAYGGLCHVMPRFATLLTIFVVASIGLPGTGSFIGEFLILVGTSYHSYILVLLALIGIVVGAAYMLRMFRRMVLGPVTPYVSNLPDLTRREMVAVIPMAVVVFTIGLYPAILLDPIHATVASLVERLAQR